MRRPAATHGAVSADVYDEHRTGWHEIRRLDVVRAHLPNGGLVVDLGCGSDRMTSLIGAADPTNRLVGLDIDERLVHYARDHHGSATTTFTVGSIDVLPPEPAIDLLVSVDVLHHVLDTETLYRSVVQRLRPHGRWIVFEPNVLHPAVTWSQERMKRAGLGEDHFLPRRETALMRRCGLVVERRSYLLAGPQRDSISARLDRIGRIVERCPVIGSSVALIVTHGGRC